MAKKIRNPIEVKVIKDDGEFEVSAHYGLSCDEYPELEIRKGIPITLSSNLLNDIDEEVMEQVNEHEGIS